MRQYKLEDHAFGVELNLLGFRQLVLEYESASDDDLKVISELEVGEEYYAHEVLVRRLPDVEE